MLKKLTPTGVAFNTDGTKMFVLGQMLEMTLMNTLYQQALMYLQPLM